MDKKINNNEIQKVLKIIFIITMFYYIFWIVIAIYFSIRGIDSGWAMPAMSNGKLIYGPEAFFSGIIIGILYTINYFWFVPLYQILYLIYKYVIIFLNNKIKKL